MSLCLGMHAVAYTTDVEGYCLFYEIDGTKFSDRYKLIPYAERIFRYILNNTKCCLWLETVHGYHFISPTLLSYNKWRILQAGCHSIYPSDHFGCILRISQKADEHVMQRYIHFRQFYDVKVYYSSWHFRVIQLLCKNDNKDIEALNKIAGTKGIFCRYKTQKHNFTEKDDAFNDNIEIR